MRLCLLFTLDSEYVWQSYDSRLVELFHVTSTYRDQRYYLRVQLDVNIELVVTFISSLGYSIKVDLKQQSHNSIHALAKPISLGTALCIALEVSHSQAFPVLAHCCWKAEKVRLGPIKCNDCNPPS